jgi:hypothetical protein
VHSDVQINIINKDLLFCNFEVCGLPDYHILTDNGLELMLSQPALSSCPVGWPGKNPRLLIERWPTLTHSECQTHDLLPTASVKHTISVGWSRGAGISIIGGQIFIYSCSARLISFEIDCFYSLWTRIYEYLPPQLSIFRRLWDEAPIYIPISLHNMPNFCSVRLFEFNLYHL